MGCFSNLQLPYNDAHAPLYRSLDVTSLSRLEYQMQSRYQWSFPMEYTLLEPRMRVLLPHLRAKACLFSFHIQSKIQVCLCTLEKCTAAHGETGPARVS